MLDCTCAHLLIKSKGKSRHEVLKQKSGAEFSEQWCRTLPGQSHLSETMGKCFAIAAHAARPSACPLWWSFSFH